MILYPADLITPLLLCLPFAALDHNKSFKYLVLILSAFTGCCSFWMSFCHVISNNGKKVIIIFLLTDSNDSVYQVLIPLQQDTEEEEEEKEVLSKSLLLNFSVSEAVLKGTSLVALDKDHIAVLGSLNAPKKQPKGSLKNRIKML